MQTVIFDYQKLSHPYFNAASHNLAVTSCIQPNTNSLKYSNNPYDSGIGSANNLTPLYLTSSTPSQGLTGYTSSIN